MIAFLNSRAGVKFSAILWTVATVIWIVVCVAGIAEGSEEGLTVVTGLITLMGVFNSVVQWRRWKNWNEETEVKE